MKSYVKYIGIVDKKNKNHFVEFDTGVNVITGKSSTGKSAMIEIFDYCMGSSEFNIPSGVITEYADIYFIVLAVKDIFLVLGRKGNGKKIFLKEESTLPNIEDIKKEYFEDKYFTSDFNVNLGHYFGLDINDIDEDTEIKKYTGRKKGRPSIRNMIPFLLQHQNLIANKHSLFYRFDQKEKREQTIEQFKIFAGFVTQEYFILKQQLADSERALKNLEIQQKSIDEQKKLNGTKFKKLLSEYEMICGNKLFEENIDVILSNPANYIDKLIKKEIKVDDDSDKSATEIDKLQLELNQLYAEKRKLVLKYKNIDLSIKYASAYKSGLVNTSDKIEATIQRSECPFCHSHTEFILNEANKLEEAIRWLNNELQKTPYLLDSFESDKSEIEKQIKELEISIRKAKSKIQQLENITKELENNRSLNEQTLKTKLKIENLLESLIDKEILDLEKDIKDKKNQINRYKNQLKTEFNITNKLKDAETYINNKMNEIGKNFDFEDSYKPINLKFSLDSFDLWHEKENGGKVFLRSMGSGANWVYSHLTLFLAINSFFCHQKDDSLVPPILFFDQPTQVYFPTVIKDTEDKFDPNKIKEKIGRGEVDEDLKAVTNMFEQFVLFCQKTLSETGIEPQIIITDHADNLNLKNANFEDLVNGRRWRSKGFIKISEIK